MTDESLERAAKHRQDSLWLHVTPAQSRVVDLGGLHVWEYSNSEEFARVSAARVRVSRPHGPTASPTSDRVYIVDLGEGWFQVSGERFAVAKGDVVIVPAHTEYDFGGDQMELWVIHTPSFDQSELDEGS